MGFPLTKTIRRFWVPPLMETDKPARTALPAFRIPLARVWHWVSVRGVTSFNAKHIVFAFHKEMVEKTIRKDRLNRNPIHTDMYIYISLSIYIYIYIYIYIHEKNKNNHMNMYTSWYIPIHTGTIDVGATEGPLVVPRRWWRNHQVPLLQTSDVLYGGRSSAPASCRVGW